jgi:hypothetical protein
LLALITALDHIVGIKNIRFGTHASAASELTKESVFCRITEPSKQIWEIVRSICEFFNATQTEKRRSLIRVTLAVIQDKKIVSLPAFFPSDHPIKASVSILNHPKSTFLIAARTRKMVIIENIQKELKKPKVTRRFVDTENEEDNKGYMICYPVYYYNGSENIPYVISIHSDEPDYFKNEFKDLYEHSLHRFALRLSVEHSLLILRENLCDQQISD